MLAVFAIIVRFQLAQFKKAGPNLYLLLMLISAVAGLVYIIAVNINISGYGVNVEYSDQISQLVVLRSAACRKLYLLPEEVSSVCELKMNKILDTLNKLCYFI